MARLVRLAARGWWAVILVWFALAGILHTVAPPFAEVATFDETAFLPADAPALEGGRLVAEGWPDDDLSRTAAIVVERPAGLTPADDAWLADLMVWLESSDSPDVFGAVTTHLDDPDLAASFVAEDGQAMFLLVGLEIPPYTPPANEAIGDLRTHIADSARPDGLEVFVTGSGGVAADENTAIESSVNRTHVLTLVLVVLILLWVYRSVVAPLVPLVTIGVALTVAQSTISLLARAGMNVSSLFETFAIVVIFGAGTDYCLFLISRFHEELAAGRAAGLANTPRLRTGTLTATTFVLLAVLGSSAATTIAGFSAQAVAEFGLYRNMGPALAIAVAITLAATLTLAPALMRLLSPILFWPSGGRPHPTGSSGAPLVLQHAYRLRLGDVAADADADTCEVIDDPTPPADEHVDVTASIDVEVGR
jgi:putative drug exporter of the RND superfamily